MKQLIEILGGNPLDRLVRCDQPLIHQLDGWWKRSSGSSGSLLDLLLSLGRSQRAGGGAKTPARIEMEHRTAEIQNSADVHKALPLTNNTVMSG